MEIKKLIINTAKSEFPISLDYQKKLRDIIVSMSQQLLRERYVEKKDMEEALIRWSKGLGEIRTATRFKDFSAIKHKKLRERIIEINTSDTISSAVKTYSNEQELKDNIYYYDVFLFVGILLRLYKLPMHGFENIMISHNFTPSLIEKYFIDYTKFEKQRRVQVRNRSRTED